MDLEELCRESKGWIQLAQDRSSGENTVKNIGLDERCGIY
jgi:hypothetical protein